MHSIKVLKYLVLVFLLFSFMITGCSNKTSSEMPPNFKVAFIGDQGLSNYSKAVLRLIKNENASIVIHQGDLDYEDNPDKWDRQINEILGADFPYFASIGNHDDKVWISYQRKLMARLSVVKDASCTGNLGVNSACYYKGLFFVLSGVGIRGYNHSNYIKQELVKDDSVWRICSWHENQRLMQVGNNKDSVGWEPYEECRKNGAIVATANEHSYSRTHLMDNFENQSIASMSKTLMIEKGKTFAFVSGLGGRSIRNQNDTLASNNWWASVYTAKQDANFGALFCIFSYKNITNHAYCYFKDIEGRIPDEFYVISRLP